MKFKLRQFRRNLSLKLSENFYLFRKRIGKSWDQFVDKGHEKMTIMFIPHNERKIFNFQISKFTITFFIFLFLIIIATSSYAFIKNNAIKREKELKGWRRSKKDALIKSKNPQYKFLNEKLIGQ